jgi:hypothetical protein
MPRVGPGQPVCTGVWPITGNACKNPPQDGYDTCLAHDPSGDLRWPPPAEAKRCTGTNKESGERCRKGHGPGGKVCEVHGGATGQNRAASEGRVVEAELVNLATDLVGKPVGNPLTELSKLAGRARAWMELLEARVQALLDDEPEYGEEADGKKERGIRYRGGAGEQTRAEVQLYERAMAQLGTLLTAIARLNIDARLAAITERQAEAVIAALEAGLTAAGVSEPGQRTAAKAAASRELRLVR